MGGFESARSGKVAAEVSCGVGRYRRAKWRSSAYSMEVLLEMERSNGRAKEEDQGCCGLGSGPSEGLRACQPPCGLGLGDALLLPKEDLASAVRIL